MALWQRLTTHIAAGFRLRKKLSRLGVGRRGLEGAEAILDPRGKVAHAEPRARNGEALSALRHAAVAVDRARGPLRRRDPEEALDIWRGLVIGRWSLIDHFDTDGRRFVIARRNDPRFADPRALTPRERQIVRYAALGKPNKLIAYALGFGESVISTHLSTAMRKLGARSRADLIGLLGRFGPP